MPRKPVVLQSEFPYNISARCINREWFNLDMSFVWTLFCEELNRTCQDHNLLVHSFVLMNNHYHMIASTPDANISQCMQQFNLRTSLRLARAGNRMNETFAGRHFKCILQQPNYYLNAYKYNYRNPIAAQLCERVESYPFSSLQFVLGLAPKPFPMAEDTTYLSDTDGTLSWLNTTPDPEKLEGVRFGLRHPYFKSKKHRNRGGPLIRDNETI